MYANRLYIYVLSVNKLDKEKRSFFNVFRTCAIMCLEFDLKVRYECLY